MGPNWNNPKVNWGSYTVYNYYLTFDRKMSTSEYIVKPLVDQLVNDIVLRHERKLREAKKLDPTGETSDFYIISKGFKASSKVWIRHGQFMLSLVSRTSTSVPMSPAPSPFAKKECLKRILNTIIQCWVIVQLERQRPRHVVHPVERRKLKHHRRWKGPFYPNLKTTTHRLYQVR